MNLPKRDGRLNAEQGRKRPPFRETTLSNLEEKASDLGKEFESMETEVQNLELAMRTHAKRLHTLERCRNKLEEIFTGSLSGWAIYCNLKVFFSFVLAEMKSRGVEVTDEKMAWHLLHSSGVLKVFGDSITKLGLKSDDFCNTRRLLALVYVIRADIQREAHEHIPEKSENVLDSELRSSTPNPHSDLSHMEQLNLLDFTASTEPESYTDDSITTRRCSFDSNVTEHIDLLDIPDTPGSTPYRRTSKHKHKKSKRRSSDSYDRLRKCRDWYRFYCNGDTSPNVSQRVENREDTCREPSVHLINNIENIPPAVNIENNRSARKALHAETENVGRKRRVHYANGGQGEVDAMRENVDGTQSIGDANETVLNSAKKTTDSRQSVDNANIVSRSDILKRYIVDDVILHYVKGMIDPIADAVTNVPVKVKCIGDWDVGADMKYLVKRIVYIVLYALNIGNEGPLLTLAN